jgi:hypothetical protein
MTIVACAFSCLSLSVLLPPGLAAEETDHGKLIFEDDFENGADRWETTDDTNWALHDHGDGKAFGLVGRRSKYERKYTSPYNIALVKDLEVADFVMTLKVKSTLDTGGHRDCCLFFNHQDADHFYYVHLGAKPDPRSGQAMIVNGAPRRALSNNKNDTPWDDGWHDVKLVRDTKSGTIKVYFDDMEKPHIEAVDKTFGKGRIGIGSYDDMNDFDDIKIYAK